jgi:ElaB/YqjD/DUF883 family membrane-anchored ribosome-binding protein
MLAPSAGEHALEEGMNDRTADVHRDIALTRERMSETIAELDTRISHRVATVKEKLDVIQLAQEHPWPALAIAVGLGVLLGGTGADAKAARATVRAAKAAPGATADLASRGLNAAKGLVGRDGNGSGSAEEAAPQESSFGDRLRSTITRAIGVDTLLGQMRDAADELSRPASYAGQRVPQNTGQQL